MQTRPDHIAANAPETIDANFHCHFSGLSPQDLGVKFQDSKRRAEVPGWRVDVIDPTTSSGQVVRKLVCASWLRCGCKSPFAWARRWAAVSPKPFLKNSRFGSLISRSLDGFLFQDLRIDRS